VAPDYLPANAGACAGAAPSPRSALQRGAGWVCVRGAGDGGGNPTHAGSRCRSDPLLRAAAAAAAGAGGTGGGVAAGHSLGDHEWMKHGSCTALTSQMYLTEALYKYNSLAERSNGHSLLRATAEAMPAGGTVSLQALQRAYALNASLDAPLSRHAAFACNDAGRLTVCPIHAPTPTPRVVFTYPACEVLALWGVGAVGVSPRCLPETEIAESEFGGQAMTTCWRRQAPRGEPGPRVPCPASVSGRFHILCGRFDWDLPTCCVFLS
jgi:hypothetical protein